jgi:hypothetical protein
MRLLDNLENGAFMKNIITLIIFFHIFTAQAQNVELICKNFSFGMSVGTSTSRNTSITYEKITILDSTGTSKTIFAPTRIIAIQQFLGTTLAAGARGEFLTPGQCSFPTVAIKGVSMDVRSNKPYIQFANFSSNFVQVGHGAFSPATVNVSVNLPPCASGIRRFRLIMENPNSFFLNDLPGNVTCIE